MVDGQDRKASGTGAETAPELAEAPDGRRAVLTPPSKAARVYGGLAGAVAGRAAGRALEPAIRRAALRWGLPEDAVVRTVEVLLPLALAVLLSRQAAHPPRVKVVRRVP